MVFPTSQEVLHSLPPATTLLESDWLSSTRGACGQREPLLGGRLLPHLLESLVPTVPWQLVVLSQQK